MTKFDWPKAAKVLLSIGTVLFLLISIARGLDQSDQLSVLQALNADLQVKTTQATQNAELAQRQLTEAAQIYTKELEARDSELVKLRQVAVVTRDRIAQPYKPRKPLGDATLLTAQENAAQLNLAMLAPSAKRLLGGYTEPVTAEGRLVEGQALVTLSTQDSETITEVVGNRLPLVFVLLDNANEQLVQTSAKVVAEQKLRQQTELTLNTERAKSEALSRELKLSEAMVTASEPPFFLADSRFWVGTAAGGTIVIATVVGLLLATQ